MRYKDFAGHTLNEIEDRDVSRRQDDGDKFTKQSASDTRKPKLTLRGLNRLKKMRAVKDLENSKKEGLLGIMYGVDSQGDDDGGL